MNSKIKGRYKSFHVAIASSLLLLCASGQAMAQGAIRVDCNDRFADELKWKLSDPEKPVFGVKAMLIKVHRCRFSNVIRR